MVIFFLADVNCTSDGNKRFALVKEAIVYATTPEVPN